MNPFRVRGAVIGAIVLVVVVGAIALAAVTRSAGPTASPAADAAGGTQAFGAVGTSETVPCPSYLTEGAAITESGKEVEGKTFSCGVVVVPENHDKPDGRTIELFYLKLHSTAPKPAPDPLVYLAGGPGSTGSYELTANPLLHKNLNRIRESRDIIAYDQRGTGYSNYLLCAPFESALGILQDRDKNPKISQTIEDLKRTELGIGYGALRANLCGVGTRLLAGVDLAQYNSVASARDLPVLTKALGYTQGYSLYGTSYGTRLALYAMREVPDGIRGVVLDGPSGTQTPNVMWSNTKSVQSYVELFRQCAADPACASAYPRLAERFGALLDKLAKQPLVFDPPLVVNPPLTVVFPKELKQIDADFFLKLAAIDNIALNGGFASSVPRLIRAAEEGDVDFFRTSSISAAAAPKDNPGTVAPTGKNPLPSLEADQPLYEVPFLTLLSLAQTAAAQAQTGIDTQWLTVVLGDLAKRLEAGENQADLMEALLRLAVVPNTGTSAQDLTDFADGNLSPSAAKAANALVATMSRNDVRTTMWSIQDVAMAMGTEPDQRSFSNAMGYAVNCAEDLAFSSLDDAKKNLSRSPYPQLASFPMAVSEQSLVSCVSYPKPLDAGVVAPVVSGIPTLVYLGALDVETPVDWGREVATGLSRSTVVEWKNQGHIAAAHDQKLCAGDIAAAFLDDPSRRPDVSCAQADAYDLTFALK